ncbi:MAG: SDR family oxidoreductase [Rhodothermales bacterium]|nr:SDR family oxidoreductase [Rhodothermales bacterium]
MNLKDKIAIITGASSGLGRALSEKFVAEGSTVFGLARRQDRLDTIAEKLGEQFVPVHCDIQSPASIDSAFAAIMNKTPVVDVLVNNAGLGRFGPIESISVEDIDVQSEVNVRGVLLCAQHVAPVMRSQNGKTGFGGHIVNVASIAGLIGNAEISVYNATKFAVRGLSEALMKELRNDGIKVSCIFPGTFDTEFFDTAGVEMRGRAMTVDAVAETVMHVVQTPDNYLISEVTMRPLRTSS